jgi:hypothetical protein
MVREHSPKFDVHSVLFYEYVFNAAFVHDQINDEFGKLEVKAHPQWSGNKGGWELLGGNFPPGSKVSAASRKPGHLDIFALNGEGNVYHVVQCQ